LNKIVSIKTTSAIFLAIVLVTGTIALSIPSFMIGAAQASSDREKDHDNKKSYGKDNYESQYSSYEKDNNNYKSKKDSSSSSVSIKKVKCNNINVNLNGLDVNIGASNGNSSIAEAQASEEDEGETITSSFENDERNNNGYNQNDKDFKFVCINNNNNTVVTVNETTPEPEPPISECEECFEANLNATLQEDLEEAIAEGYPIFFRGEITDVFSIAEFCELIEKDATFSDLRGSLENLFESLPVGPGAEVFNKLSLCIAEALDIPVPDMM